MELKVTESVAYILNNYDVDDLMRTIPDDYKLNSTELSLYKKHIKSNMLTPMNVVISKANTDWLSSFASNFNQPIALVFNFLMECVANCGKINTKKVKYALDFYYNAANDNKELYRKILNGYSDSVYYNEERGLDEGDIAKFLIFTEEGKALINNK